MKNDNTAPHSLTMEKTKDVENGGVRAEGTIDSMEMDHHVIIIARRRNWISKGRSVSVEGTDRKYRPLRERRNLKFDPTAQMGSVSAWIHHGLPPPPDPPQCV